MAMIASDLPQDRSVPLKINVICPICTSTQIDEDLYLTRRKIRCFICGYLES